MIAITSPSYKGSSCLTTHTASAGSGKLWIPVWRGKGTKKGRYLNYAEPPHPHTPCAGLICKGSLVLYDESWQWICLGATRLSSFSIRLNNDSGCKYDKAVKTSTLCVIFRVKGAQTSSISCIKHQAMDARLWPSSERYVTTSTELAQHPGQARASVYARLLG